MLDLEASGICGTDVHFHDGTLALDPGCIIGHEFVGRVRALGEGVTGDGLGQTLAVGDCCIACIALPCGTCFCCRQGETASCLSFGVTNAAPAAAPPHFHGGYAELLAQPAATLVRVPADVSVAAVAAFACAGPTCIRAFAFAGDLRGDELVVVQGTGPVGLFAVAWAAARGCRVVAIGSGNSPRRLEMAARLGATLVLDYRSVPAAQRQEQVRELAADLGRGNGADVVFEATGAPGALPEGLELLRTLGTYIVPGQYSSSGAVAIRPELITFKALRIIGSGQYKLGDIGTYLAFLRQSADLQQDLAACVTHRYPLAQVNQAMADVAAGTCVKAVFVP